MNEFEDVHLLDWAGLNYWSFLIMSYFCFYWTINKCAMQIRAMQRILTSRRGRWGKPFKVDILFLLAANTCKRDKRGEKFTSWCKITIKKKQQWLSIKRNKPAVEVDLPLQETSTYFEQQRETRKKGQKKDMKK